MPITCPPVWGASTKSAQAKWFSIVIVCLLSISFHSEKALAIQPKQRPTPSKNFTFDVIPETFHLNVYCNGVKEQASTPLPSATVANVVKTATQVSWEYPDRHISVAVEKKADYLDVTISSAEKGSFTWPKVEGESYMMPMWEGKYIPAKDPWWKQFLKGQNFTFMEDFSMGFFAVNKPKYAIVYVAKNRFNNAVKFPVDTTIKFSFTHDFTSISKDKTYGFRIYLTNNTPVAISAIYKDYVQENGWFKTLEQKAAENTNIRKLYGAPHIYFWTHGVITRNDINWKSFQTVLKMNQKLMNWVIKVVTDHYDKDTGAEFNDTYQECRNQGQINSYQKKIITNALNKAITLKELYNPAIFGYPVRVSPNLLSEQKLYVFNKALLKSALKNAITNPVEWGKGDVALLNEIYKSGVSKAWIGLPDWADGLMNPSLVKTASRLGYLIGPYDAYHSIQQDEDMEWRSNWFPDSSLYNNATITDASGKKPAGFLGRGRQLNPTLTLPAVKQRVAGILADKIPYNSWFVDCDAFGEVFDDYTPGHITTQQEDFNARLARMEYIGKNVGMVVGSEGGSDYTSRSLAFAQGLDMPVFNWSDPDFRQNQDSPYYLGGYWNGQGKIAGLYVKVTPLKPVYEQVYVNPVYNLPLFRLVYNNSVITTPHWESGSLKIKNQVGTRMLSELLYNTPPMYHLDRVEWDLNKCLILKQVKAWSKLHQKAVKLPMTAFNILSADRMVQQTIFGKQLKVTVNFSEKALRIGRQLIPARAAIIDDGAGKVVYSVKGILD